MNGIFNLRFARPRRDFLKASAGLTLGVIVAPKVFAQAAAPGNAGGGVLAAAPLEPNAFVRIGTDNTVTVIVKHTELGQGTFTGLPTLVAEELDADWSQIRAEPAPADVKLYYNLAFGEGKAQGTGGSTAMANSYEQMRKAGAAARAMLVSAAAQRWNVPPDSVAVSKGVVQHRASGRKATFGELAPAAAKLPVPGEVKLKEAKDFVYIGKRVPRTDSRAKTTGTAQYTQDVKLPGMLTAVVLHAPRFGSGKVLRWRQGESAAARGRRRADPLRRGGAGAGFLVGKTGSGCAHGGVGRNRCLPARLGRDPCRVSQARRDARHAGTLRRRCGEGASRSSQDDPGRVRISLPCACRDGTDELRRAARRWRL